MLEDAPMFTGFRHFDNSDNGEDEARKVFSCVPSPYPLCVISKASHVDQPEKQASIRKLIFDDEITPGGQLAALIVTSVLLIHSVLYSVLSSRCFAPRLEPEGPVTIA